MKDSTKVIIKTALDADATITPEQHGAVIAAIEGKTATITATPSSVVRFNEAARRLGLCKMSVRNLVDRGVLTPVKMGNRQIGVTAESVERFINGGTAA